MPPAPNSAPAWLDPDPFVAARRWHEFLVRALLQSFEGRAVASHQSTLVEADVSLWRSDLRVAHLTRVNDEHSRHRRHAVIHPPCGIEPTVVGGLASVPTAVAVVQVGLIRHGDAHPVPLESLVAADNALFKEHITLEELEAAVALHERVPGITAVRELLRYATASHESVGETRMMHNLRLLGFIVEPQKEVTIGAHPYRTDGKVVGHNVFVEFDGLAKYLMAEAGAGSAPTDSKALDLATVRRRLAAERVRQIHIEEKTDAEFVRFTWPDLDHLQAMKARMEQAIQRADRRQRGSRSA